VPYLLLELIIIKANPGVKLRRRLATQNVVFVFVSVCVCGLLLAFAFIFFFSRLGISWERKKKKRKEKKEESGIQKSCLILIQTSKGYHARGKLE
jgi:phosphate/sulfate permease